MNKQQLIDKAIDDLKGVLPWGGAEDCMLVYFPRPSSYSMSHPICIPNGAYDVCTRREFEERKAEREAEKSRMGNFMYGNALSGFNPKVTIDGGRIVVTTCGGGGAAPKQQAHWYDYENQKALRLPPVGEIVEMYATASWFDVKLIAMDEGKPIVKYLGCGNYYPASQSVKFYRPADWNKLRIAAVNELTDIIESYCVDVVSAARITKAILAAGYRKCHNKAPSDKE